MKTTHHIIREMFVPEITALDRFISENYISYDMNSPTTKDGYCMVYKVELTSEDALYLKLTFPNIDLKCDALQTH